jgi:hypothetical protein
MSPNFGTMTPLPAPWEDERIGVTMVLMHGFEGSLQTSSNEVVLDFVTPAPNIADVVQD